MYLMMIIPETCGAHDNRSLSFFISTLFTTSFVDLISHFLWFEVSVKNDRKIFLGFSLYLISHSRSTLL